MVFIYFLRMSTWRHYIIVLYHLYSAESRISDDIKCGQRKVQKGKGKFGASSSDPYLAWHAIWHFSY